MLQDLRYAIEIADYGWSADGNGSRWPEEKGEQYRAVPRAPALE
jgi:hypothetical protein